ncbi:MAG TPA: DJ-1/PfpI family protein [Planctomycetota bacterium]
MPLTTVFAFLLSALALPAQASSVDEARAAAEAAWRAQDREAVVPAYRRLVEFVPEETVAWHRLGFALHRLGRFDEALAANERAAALWEHDARAGARASYGVAAALCKLGRAGEAMPWLERAVERGYRNAEMLGRDPDLEPLRKDGALERLCDKIRAGRMQVAVVVHQGVELLDFAGPAEVFAAAAGADGNRAFSVFLVAPKEGEVKSLGFARIVPNHTIANCSQQDVLVIPGGDTSELVRDEAFMKWVSEQAGRTKVLLTVCTGAFVPAQLGLLDGKEATTHHGSRQALAREHPTVKVVERKVVDNGAIVTAAGVSSGIDGALHVVARLCGENSAKATAAYLEFAWSPEPVPATKGR